MNIKERIAQWLPVSRKRYESDLAKEHEEKAKILRRVYSEHDREREQMATKVTELVGRLSVIRWEPGSLPYGDFALQLRMSPQMMQLTYDDDHRRIIAESLAYQVASEIRSCRFLQPH